MKIYIQGAASHLPTEFCRFDELFDSSPTTPIPRNVRAGLHPFAYNCYIFTSGTTGDNHRLHQTMLLKFIYVCPYVTVEYYVWLNQLALRPRFKSYTVTMFQRFRFTRFCFIFQEVPVHSLHFLPGVPKAAPMMQMKVYMGAHVLRLVDLSSDDILYITLPLYHTSASYFGVNGCICAGKSVDSMSNIHHYAKQKVEITNIAPRVKCSCDNTSLPLVIGMLHSRYQLYIRAMQPIC